MNEALFRRADCAGVAGYALGQDVSLLQRTNCKCAHVRVCRCDAVQVCVPAVMHVWCCADVKVCTHPLKRWMWRSVSKLPHFRAEVRGTGCFRSMSVSLWKCHGVCVEKAVFRKNRKKVLTFLGISRRIMKTNAILRSDPDVFKIAHEHKACLGSKPFFVKNRVWFNGHKGLWEFRGKFSCEKRLAQFVFGFGVFGATARLGRKWGLSFHALSRLKGIETYCTV